jgi:hypothetical protein
MIRVFLDSLYPQGGGFFSLWEGQTKGSRHHDIRDPGWKDDVERLARRWDAEKRDVYLGVALRGCDLGSSKRGGKKDVVALPGFFADLDVGNAGHKGTTYPPTIQEAIKVLIAFREKGSPPPSLLVHTGGGLHAYWLFQEPLAITDVNRARVTEELKAWQGRLIAVAAETGYTLDNTADLARVLRLPGTNNWKTGEPRPVKILAGPAVRYSFEQLCSVPRAPTPAPSQTPEPAAAADADARLTSEILGNLRAKLKATRNPERKGVIKAILAGEPFAKPGERDRALQRIASWMAWIEPESAPEILAEILIPSLEAMEEESPDDFLSFDDAVKKIERAQGDARIARAKEKEQNEAILRGLEKGSGRPVIIDYIPAPAEPTSSNVTGLESVAGGTVPSSSTTSTSLALVTAAPSFQPLTANAPEILLSRPQYSPEEMGDFRLEQERISQQTISVEQWRRRWIVQRGEYFYVHGPYGYEKPVARGELEVSLPRDLSPLPQAYFSWKKMTVDGSVREKTAPEVLKELATAAKGVVSSMFVEKSYYDAQNQVFFESCCPLRRLEPLYDEQCDYWLRLLGGTKAEKLLDWLATLTDQKHPSCALYLTGPKSSGKNMLAIAASRLWTDSGFVPMAEVFANFEENLQKCPVVVADEKLPELFRGPVSTEALRALITSESRPLHRKFQPNADLRGCLRVMLLANKDDMIKIGDDNLGKDALEAVAIRFLHIRAADTACSYLSEIGGRHGDGAGKKGTSDWLEGDRLTKHLVWLKLNRKVKYGDRFVVEGDLGEMKRHLAIQGTVPSLVAQFVLRFLENPKKYGGILKDKPVVVQDGQVYVSASTLCDSWDLLGGTRGAPLLKNVNTALENIAARAHQERIMVSINGKATYKRYWPIDPEYLFAFAEKNTAIDVELVKENIRAFVSLGIVDGGKKVEPTKSNSVLDLLHLGFK